jgi:hypothetical protein
VAEPTSTQPPAPTAPASAPPGPTKSRPVPPRPTNAEAFYRAGFGCLGNLVFRIAVVVIIVLVADWRAREKYAKREADRAATSETAARLADEFAKDTDAEGRFVRKPEGPLPETDAWGRQLRLSYKPGLLSDGLEVRSAGPDGEWNTWDDVKTVHHSRISNKALAREAAGGVFDAARDKLFGKPDDKKDEKDKKKEKK